jgi:hypothetical protein
MLKAMLSTTAITNLVPIKRKLLLLAKIECAMVAEKWLQTNGWRNKK